LSGLGVAVEPFLELLRVGIQVEIAGEKPIVIVNYFINVSPIPRMQG
jgi:hypothetical protein